MRPTTPCSTIPPTPGRFGKREKRAPEPASRLSDGRDTFPGWEDAAVDPARLGEYLREFDGLTQRYGLRYTLYGHFGQGCIHTRLDFDLVTSEGIARYRAFVEEAARLVVKYGGSLSGEHGDGHARAELLPIMFGAEIVDAFREVQAGRGIPATT